MSDFTKNLVGLFLLCLGAATVSCGAKHEAPGHAAGATAPPSSTPVAAVTGEVIYVVSGGTDTVVVVDAASRTVKSTISLKNAKFPHHIALDAKAKRLALAIPGFDLSGGHGAGSGAHAGKGAVLVLDAVTGATLVARQLAAGNHNAAFAPSGDEIWTTQMKAKGEVLVLDAATLATRTTIAVGAMPAEVTFSSDGKRAFVANGESNDVTVIDAATKAVIKTIAVGKGPVGAWPGNDNVMYVDNEAGKSLTAIDVATLNVVRTYNLGFTPAYAATAPGGELWVSDTENGMLVFFAAGSDKKLGDLATGAGAHAIAFSSDGKLGYVTNQTANTVSVVDVASKSVLAAIPVAKAPNGLVVRAP